MFSDGKESESVKILKHANDTVCLIPNEEWTIAADRGFPGTDFLEKMISHDDGSTRFESYEQYDSLCIMVPDWNDIEKPPSRVLIYLADGHLILVCQPLSVVDDLIHLEKTKCLSSEIPSVF